MSDFRWRLRSQCDNIRRYTVVQCSAGTADWHSVVVHIWAM